MSLFFIKIDEKFSNDWARMGALMNMAGEILSRNFDENYEKIAEKFYEDRRNIANELERRYVCDIAAVRGQFNWNFVTSRNILVLSIPDSLVQNQVLHMTENKLSFISTTGEKSDDEFSNSERMQTLVNDYIKTEPNKMGFGT